MVGNISNQVSLWGKLVLLVAIDKVQQLLGLKTILNYSIHPQQNPDITLQSPSNPEAY